MTSKQFVKTIEQKKIKSIFGYAQKTANKAKHKNKHRFIIKSCEYERDSNAKMRHD